MATIRMKTLYTSQVQKVKSICKQWFYISLHIYMIIFTHAIKIDWLQLWMQIGIHWKNKLLLISLPKHSQIWIEICILQFPVLVPSMLSDHVNKRLPQQGHHKILNQISKSGSLLQVRRTPILCPCLFFPALSFDL